LKDNTLRACVYRFELVYVAHETLCGFLSSSVLVPQKIDTKSKVNTYWHNVKEELTKITVVKPIQMIYFQAMIHLDFV